MNGINLLMVILLALALAACKSIKANSPVIVDASQILQVEVPPAPAQTEHPYLVCNTNLTRHEATSNDSNSRITPGSFYTLDFFAFSAILDQFGVASICLPQEVGSPFISENLDAANGTAHAGKMIRINFEDLPSLSLVYSTYDFSKATEFDTYATTTDYDGIKISGVTSFERIHTGLCFGRCTLFKTRVFPSEDHYLALVLDLGTYEFGETKDNMIDQFNAGIFPKELSAKVAYFNKIAEKIQML